MLLMNVAVHVKTKPEPEGMEHELDAIIAARLERMLEELDEEYEVGFSVVHKDKNYTHLEDDMVPEDRVNINLSPRTRVGP